MKVMHVAVARFGSEDTVCTIYDQDGGVRLRLPRGTLDSIAAEIVRIVRLYNIDEVIANNWSLNTAMLDILRARGILVLHAPPPTAAFYNEQRAEAETTAVPATDRKTLEAAIHKGRFGQHKVADVVLSSLTRSEAYLLANAAEAHLATLPAPMWKVWIYEHGKTTTGNPYKYASYDDLWQRLRTLGSHITRIEIEAP